MFVIRQAHPDDCPILLKLARMVHFINLPPDEQTIMDKIRRSRESFAAEPEDAENGVYMFILEDQAGNVLGTSQIIARMGTPEDPHTYLLLRKREMYAPDVQIGATHMTVQLQTDTDGPTELGGLILQPSFRGHPARLGKQLSLIRFHFIGLHRERFRDQLLAEMMAALTAQGTNAFWEYFGRRFINLSYEEADRLSTKSKTFILNLMPREEIYVTLLPPEARMLIGKVGVETEPARAMLERLGFEFHDHIDPFDAGPYLHARTDDISLVRDTRWATLGDPVAKSKVGGQAFVSHEGDEFRALMAPIRLSADGDRVHLTREAMKALWAQPGDRIGLTLLAAPPSSKPGRSSGSRPAKEDGSIKTPTASRGGNKRRRIEAGEGV